ncbi:DUF2125 domain-containing protein [Asaia astilbis]|uniref:DUF2125 domain-containing protein n=1 Tax=Asaia astilbis TaxID=610244 RepID=UPI0018DC3567|nr:DUF2125 domain-containing protein [Asaia astilbis]
MPNPKGEFSPVKKGVLGLLLGVIFLLIISWSFSATRLYRLEREIPRLTTQLSAQGWHLTWQKKTPTLYPWAGSLLFNHPSLTGPKGILYVGETLSISGGLLHPFSFTLKFQGTQILRLNENLSLSGGNLTGHLDPASKEMTFAAPSLSATVLPFRGVKSLTLMDVKARLIPGGEAGPESSAWAMDLHAAAALPEFDPQERASHGSGSQVTDLFSLLPPPSHLHLILTALRAKSAKSGQSEAGGRFLIQTASFDLGPLSCTMSGSLTHDGAGTLWAHLSGLQGFVRYWIANAPAALRTSRDYVTLLSRLNEQSARIPDRLDLPVPTRGSEILLQNHIFAIITGHLDEPKGKLTP